MTARADLARVATLGAALWAGAASAAGSTYYVSPTGADGNTGSSNSPLREIRRALVLVHPGDTVRVADGQYLGFTASGLHGTAAAPITVAAQGSEAWVQRTTDRSDNRDNIFITFSSFLVVDGLNSSNAPRAAVRIDQSPNITVRNGRFGPNATWGIFTDFSDDLLIENNECFGSQTQHGIYVSNSGDRPVVRGNRCHDNAAAGIHMNADVSVGGDGTITGALIENNVVWNNGVLGGSAINMDGVQDSRVCNNLLYGNHATGIALFRIDGAQGPRGNLVAHNTIDQATDARWPLLIGQASGTNVVRNNILHQRNTASVRGCVLYGSAEDARLTDADRNTWGGNAYVSTNDATSRQTLAAWQASGHEPHTIGSSIATLVVAAPGDYHLKAGSPAIDAGQSLPQVTTDMDWLTRPAGAASDIGAYEWGALPAAPEVRRITLDGADVHLDFSTLPGMLYRVESAGDLRAGFTNVVLAGVPGTGRVVAVALSGAGERAAEFYRVWLTH
jgi:parallel beta-helix repeat protein